MWTGRRAWIAGRGHVTRPASVGGRRIARALAGASVALVMPAATAAHSLGGRLESPLPFVAYLGGAAVAVAVSFVLIALSDPAPPRPEAQGAPWRIPAPVRLALRAIGLVAWLWIAAQTVIGGSSDADADVASLFLWTYGWIGLAIVSALVGPAWDWLDPFATLHDLAARVLRGLGIRGPAPQAYPARLGHWPAVAGFAFIIWLELVPRISSGRMLGLVLLAYTAVTLAGMAQYGRDAWRSRAEMFSAWFGLLGRLAPLVTVGPPEEGRLARRSFGGGLLSGGWTTALVVFVTLGTGSIIYDGISQTKVFFDLFGIPDTLVATLLLAAFLGTLVVVVLAVGKRVGLAAVGAGLLPVSLGYLVAHYASTLVVDGQRIAVAVSDPFQQGWDVFGTAFWEPRDDWLPVSVVWTVQVGAVVIGHIAGAWAGHAAARADAGAGAGAGGHDPTATGAGPLDAQRASQVPLAVLMVTLTTLTLWSLGQNLVFDAAPAAGPAAAGSGLRVPA